jgi:MoxR-like ATPase
MQERQVTIGDETHPAAEPFLVLATQNPIEQEGTYPLPEAQVDRFMLKLKVGYPTRDEERRSSTAWRAVAPDVLRHRVLLSYEAEAEKTRRSRRRADPRERPEVP